MRCIPSGGTNKINVSSQYWDCSYNRLSERSQQHSPNNKHDVGGRLASWVLAQTYDINELNYKSPQFKSMEVAKEKIVLQFSNCPNGLIAKDKVVNGFFSGEQKQWFPADAKIEGDKIAVSSKNVKSPAHVRFGFGNTLVGNVFSKEGLPFTPFRTDSRSVDQSPIH